MRGLYSIQAKHELDYYVICYVCDGGFLKYLLNQLINFQEIVAVSIKNYGLIFDGTHNPHMCFIQIFT